MAQAANVVQLKPKTLQAFEDYIRNAEENMTPSLRGEAAFLWSEGNPDRSQQVSQGKVIAQLWEGEGPAKVTNGLIHDWAGAAFAPNARHRASLVSGPELQQS